MSEIIPFDFEEQPVRIVMRGEDPWFVAADVCRVLDIANTSDALSRLDEDERMTLDNTEGQTGRGGARRFNIISESGLYALILTSRKDAARRFRKWVTAEVLPAIRRTGRYEAPAPAAPPSPDGDIAGLPYREAELWLSMVREARLTRGARAGVAIWDRSPLPPLSPRLALTIDPAAARACLDHLAGTAQPLAHDADALARLGLRQLPEGLFVMNGPCPVFDSTLWAGGLHRAMLLSLPGVTCDGPRTLAGRGARGVLVPDTLLPMETACFVVGGR